MGTLDRWLKTVAGIIAAFGKETIPGSQLKGRFSHYSFEKEGWPSATMFQELVKRLSSQPKAETWQYASPGVIGYKMTDRIENDIKLAVAAVLANEERIQNAAKATRDLRRKVDKLHELKNEGGDSFDQKELAANLKQLRTATHDLLASLPVNPETVWDSTSGNVEKTARMADSLQKRLRELANVHKSNDAQLL